MQCSLSSQNSVNVQELLPLLVQLLEVPIVELDEFEKKQRAVAASSSNSVYLADLAHIVSLFRWGAP